MRSRPLLFLTFFLLASSLPAQEKIRFTSNVLSRYEIQEFPQGATPRENVNRSRIRWRPALLFFLDPRFDAGIEAEINYIHESDEDVFPPRFPEFHTPAFDRDNFKRDTVVLSRAFLRFAPSPDLEIIGGKFENPFLFSELLWDRDLRPNGAAVTVSRDFSNVRLTGRIADFYASHYLHDRTNIVAVQGSAQFRAGIAGFTFAGSYYDFDLDELETTILRTNTKTPTALLNDFNLVDLIVRFRLDFAIPFSVQFDFVKNTEAEVFTPGMAGNGDDGYLLELFLGKLIGQYDWRIGYALHRVESDAVVAAYNTDDWWFPTRGEGYRIHGSFIPLHNLILTVSYLNQTLIDLESEFERWQFTAEFTF